MFVVCLFFFFFQAEDGIRDVAVTGVQTCALPISLVLNHCVRVFGPLALAIWLARSGPQQGTPSLSVAKVTVAGKPFCISVIPETCHPPSAVFIEPELPRNPGISHT